MLLGPIGASLSFWIIWLVVWTLAGVWSRRTQARASSSFQFSNLLVSGAGFGLMFSGASHAIYHAYGGEMGQANVLWMLPTAVKWALFGVVIAGAAFAWWARFTLGGLWSASITRKEGHQVIQTGPYALVRHPIYTGMLLSAYALAIQSGSVACLLGAGLLHYSFWTKARVEEQFLQDELGAAAYADYRARTPMLIPFLKAGS